MNGFTRRKWHIDPVCEEKFESLPEVRPRLNSEESPGRSLTAQGRESPESGVIDDLSVVGSNGV
jgi:hypothetical protein